MIHGITRDDFLHLTTNPAPRSAVPGSRLLVLFLLDPTTNGFPPQVNLDSALKRRISHSRSSFWPRVCWLAPSTHTHARAGCAIGAAIQVRYNH